MSSNPTPTLQSFNPHAVHYFTNAAASPRQSYPTHSGVPRAAYPMHVLAASASPAAAAIPASQAIKTTATPSSLSSSFSSSSSASNASNAVKIQAPKPMVQAKGFSVSGLGAGGTQAQGVPKRIFEPFSHERSVTPELDDVLKKKAAPWGQWELEQSFHPSK